MQTAQLCTYKEDVQLTLQNIEGLFDDSQQVSIPTTITLLEIGLEEIAKTWGILLGYEKNLLESIIKELIVALEGEFGRSPSTFVELLEVIE